MLIYANLGIYLWAPTFLMRTFNGLTLAEAAFHAVFWSSVGSMSGLFITARVTDRLVVRRPTARFDMTIVGMALCALTVLGLAAAPTLVGCCLGLFAFGFARGVLECTVYPAMFDVIVPQFRAACTGMAGCWAFLFGSLAPFALGWLGERFSLRTGIATLTVFEVIGVVLLVIARTKFLLKDMKALK
jgi:MFS family permease